MCNQKRLDAHRSRPATGPCVIAIGNFDGVHCGHQVVLQEAVAQAREHGLAARVLTFDPHPATIVGREAPGCLTRLSRKIELIQRVDARLEVVVQPFDAAFAHLTPLQFVRDVLCEQLEARHVRVGANFRFGACRGGDVALLDELGRRFGVQVQAAPFVSDACGRLSSTRVRAAVRAGDMALASSLLSRPHSVSGNVLRGQGLARRWGFPTANVGWIKELCPGHGVYAVAVDRMVGERAERLGLGACNVGVRPTVGAGFSVEVHLLDFDENLYDSRLRVHFIEKLRDEKHYGSVEELTAQLHRDVEQARERLRDLQAPTGTTTAPWF